MANAEVLYRPYHEGQERALAAYDQAQVLLISGPQGTGKTHAAVGMAASAVLGPDKRYQKLYLTRPTVECGPSLGYLPGDVNEKMGPWLAPVSDVLSKMSFIKPEDFFAHYCEVIPLQVMRGRTFQRGVAILDEAENCTLAQIKLFLGRLDRENSKAVLCGDPEQCDLPASQRMPDGSPPFLHACKALKGIAGVRVFHLTEQMTVRSPLIPVMMKALSQANTSEGE